MEVCCKYCDSSGIIKKGIKYGKQSYRCRDCGKYFRAGDDRIKRDAEQKKLCLLLYSHNVSMRSIQSTLEKFFETKISFSVVDHWIKSASELIKFDLKNNKSRDKPQKIAKENIL